MANLTDQEKQGLKSSVYNANSAIQHLRSRVAELEQKVESLRRKNSRLGVGLSEVIRDLDILRGRGIL